MLRIRPVAGSDSPLVNKEKSETVAKFRDYPVSLSNVNYFSEEPGRGALEDSSFGMMAFIKAVGHLNRLMSAGLGQAGFLIVDRLFSEFGYIQNLAGPYLLYPTVVFKIFLGSHFLPFKIPSGHEEWSATPDCQPKNNYVLSETECNIFTNYGFNVNILLAILFFGASISFWHSKVYRKRSKVDQADKNGKQEASTTERGSSVKALSLESEEV